MKKLQNTLFNIYKNIFSKPLKFLFGGGCRYYPTCSDYSRKALAEYGLYRGTWVSIKRLFRCHPFSKTGFYDPLLSK
ncbi:membrane protein insertion efficiency factor YidD [Patescibacteria group bacterium]|nr:membrane protein insertion efficiency factor YidD [Patescibacteria group bacterium]MBU0776709.1 membrane protein insertion efficiency factor YidD [Patescibacteria group bacterium]MBU0846153.1 membrane protein insertion efficiency factor YidD [Patescibacteria group bacterium]MBU0922758.1 membrane protein insertion efficiency factor YidD [Patescibacteria group bacterium]MBU1066275.1 membrane protein insertion efficiency factor YidD [Patescibacteria group bacterium]